MAIHRSAASFRTAMQRYDREASVGADRLVRNAVRRAGTLSLEQSPVKTAYFRRHWRVVPHGQDPPLDIGGQTRAQLEATKSPAQTNALTAEAANAIEDATDAVKAGDFVDVANATPYGVFLDEGSSRQAPLGISAVVAQSVRLWLRTQRVLGRQVEAS